MTPHRFHRSRSYLVAMLSFSLCGLTALAARDTPIDPDDRDYLRRQFAWFEAQTPARQQQLRQLNERFHQLDAETQARYTRVMQQYNAWLAKLPEVDQNAVIQAANGPERLKVIRDIREREWVATLPKVQRDEYAKLTPENRAQQVREWRAEEENRTADWSIAQKNWEDLKLGRVPAIFTADALSSLDAFANNLRHSLTESERKSLDDAKAAAAEHGQIMWYAIEVVRLADSHPLLPGKIGPKDFQSLPDATKEFLRKNDPTLKKKGIFAHDDSREMKKASGRWPDYAIELAKHTDKIGLKLPAPLGDCTKAQMPPEVQTFLDKVLEPSLKKTEKGRDQLAALSRAEGRWPEYPKMIMDLAKMYRFPIPHWTLPGLPQIWDRFRAPKMLPK